MATSGSSPEGACPRCGGPLTWGRVRYHPLNRTVDGADATGTWVPSETVCLEGLRSPAHDCGRERRAAMAAGSGFHDELQRAGAGR